MKTICLNMIVKNESKIIERCLNSVKHLIDRWVIVDTGSTDGTQEVIRNALCGIPGELHERPWVNFSNNRNEALDLARNTADYILFIDADEQLILEEPLDKENISKDCFLIRLIGKSVDASRVLLINNHSDWKWEGILHEYIANANLVIGDFLPGGAIDVREKDSARSKDPEKYRKDAQILEQAIKEDPSNTRNIFYLAQTYLNGGDLQSALKYYEIRSLMGGWKEEVFWSLYMIGLLQADLKMDLKTVAESHAKAFQFDPRRAEPLYALAGVCNQMDNHLYAYCAAKLALSLPVPRNEMYLNRWIYEYGSLVRIAEAAFFIQNYQESYKAYSDLLKNPNVPPDIREIVERNAAAVEAMIQSSDVA